MKYLMIGVSAAGMSAVKTILEKDPQGEITVVSKDDCPYSRIMMYRLLAGEMDKKGILFEKEDFLEKKGVQWYRGPGSSRRGCADENHSVGRRHRAVLR